MARSVPILACLGVVACALPAHASSPLEHPPKIDYAGLRCIVGTGKAALVVGVHYGDVREKFERISYLVKNIGMLGARVKGTRWTLLVKNERIPLGLIGRRNVDHRHTMIFSDRQLARDTGQSACGGGRFELKVRATQELEVPTSSSASDLPPKDQQRFDDLVASIESVQDKPATNVLRRRASAHAESALNFNGCIFQLSSRCPGADLAGSLLGKSTMGYVVSVGGIDLRGATLDGASLAGVSMNAAQLQGVVGRGILISGSSMLGASLAGADLTGAIGSATWNSSKVLTPPFPAILQSANGSRATFAGATLSEATLTNGHFAGADFTGADLSGAALQGADLRGAHFTNADLSHANLLGADVDNADFAGADLSKATDPAGVVFPEGTHGTANGETTTDG